MGFRRETPADDNNRTERLLDQADTAFGDATATAFETVVTTGLGTDKAAAAAGNYPPAGHGYPRRG
jgi:hypothetical protein